VDPARGGGGGVVREGGYEKVLFNIRGLEEVFERPMELSGCMEKWSRTYDLTGEKRGEPNGEVWTDPSGEARKDAKNDTRKEHVAICHEK